MGWDVVNFLGGFLSGLAVEFYFERRAKRDARRESEAADRRIAQLRSDLDDLRVSHASWGGVGGGPTPPVGSLEDEVRARVRSTQDADGRVGRGALIAFFAQRGRKPSEVEGVLWEMARSGEVKEDGRWIVVV